MRQKRIVICVSGGHGLQPFMHALVNNPTDSHWTLVFNTFDSGSHTGHMRELYQQEAETIPMGDFRNFIGTSLSVRDEAEDVEIARLFQDRPTTGNGKTYQEKLHEDVDLFILNLAGRADPSIIQTISETCHAFVDEYSARHEAAPETKEKAAAVKKGHSFGNIVLTGLLRELGRDDMVKLLKLVDILPDHIDIEFMSEEKLHIEGEDLLQKKYLSEDEIDHAEVQIDPRSLQLVYDQPTRPPYSRIPQRVVDKVAEADLFIIPTGSQANSFPYAVMLLDECRKQSIDIPPILRFANLTVRPQEVNFYDEAIYMDQQGFAPIYLVCSGLNVSERLRQYQDPVSVLQQYWEKEHKHIQTSRHMGVLMYENGTALVPGIEAELYPVSPNFPDGLNGDSPMKLECGIRHRQDQVSSIIGFILSLERDSRKDMIDAVHAELTNITADSHPEKED